MYTQEQTKIEQHPKSNACFKKLDKGIANKLAYKTINELQKTEEQTYKRKYFFFWVAKLKLFSMSEKTFKTKKKYDLTKSLLKTFVSFQKAFWNVLTQN